MKILITCEHGGNVIPPAYHAFFQHQQQALNSHRGYDPGTLDLFEEVKFLADFSLKSEVSRLLVELNRSLHHRQLFSEVSKEFSAEKKEEILQQYYFPYRNSVEKQIETWVRFHEKVIHLSLHSFTRIFKGIERNTDLGILYDSSKSNEKNFSKNFKLQLQQELPGFKIRFNYPYLGKADGFTTYLRKKFPTNYIGIELEINQKYAVENQFSPAIKQAIIRVLERLRENEHSMFQ